MSSWGTGKSEVNDQERKKEEKLVLDEQSTSARHCAGNLHVTLFHFFQKLLTFRSFIRKQKLRGEIASLTFTQHVRLSRC